MLLLSLKLLAVHGARSVASVTISGEDEDVAVTTDPVCPELGLGLSGSDLQEVVWTVASASSIVNLMQISGAHGQQRSLRMEKGAMLARIFPQRASRARYRRWMLHVCSHSVPAEQFVFAVKWQTLGARVSECFAGLSILEQYAQRLKTRN